MKDENYDGERVEGGIHTAVQLWCTDLAHVREVHAGSVGARAGALGHVQWAACWLVLVWAGAVTSIAGCYPHYPTLSRVIRH